MTGVNIIDGEKLAIHGFLGALNEFHRGKMAGAEIATMFTLDAAQQAQTIGIVNLLAAAPLPTEFMRVLKDWMYLGELQLGAKYSDMPQVITRMQDEVTDQGGTLP